MSTIDKIKRDKIYDHFKTRKLTHCYDEDFHCKLLIDVFLDVNKQTISAYCVAAMITERTFYTWVKTHELFSDIYYYSKMLAREEWEAEGRRIRDHEMPIGTTDYSFEHWKMIGWARFGISKTCRIKVDVDVNASPKELYAGIIKQAREGDFTASEFKQLMESVNVGVNIHKLFDMQKEIDELKENLSLMEKNQHGHNTSPNQPA